MTTRTPERMQALSYVLCGGLSYSWFLVEELDEEAVTATIRTDGPDDDEGTYSQVHQIGPDDVARGLRMYAEYMAGTREGFPGEWKYSAENAVRAGRIKDESEFVPGVHNRADAGSYGWQMVKFDRTNGAEGDYDANTADSVMQFATLGHAIYG